jgi:hypothetical protein
LGAPINIGLHPSERKEMYWVSLIFDLLCHDQENSN